MLKNQRDETYKKAKRNGVGFLRSIEILSRVSILKMGLMIILVGVPKARNWHSVIISDVRDMSFWNGFETYWLVSIASYPWHKRKNEFRH